ncbi:MAG TPA: sugar phosphate isomerase/epimerase family protein [Tepidisphaeraceae bacterium]|jgi:sugar phosphate isomerase/epimerase|nr:sugar phosphate isomerase/epimerase family protein [Tepidisphaeraceae bacterium]
MTLDRLKLGIAASAFGDDFRSAAQRARTLGFDGLQFDAYSPSLNLPDLSGSGRREFLRLLSAQDRQLIGLRYDVGPRGFGPGADVDQALDRLARVMELAAALGCPLVCVEAGPLPAQRRTSEPKPTITSDQLGLLVLSKSPASDISPQEIPAPPIDPAVYSSTDSALAELGARADRYSVVVAFRSEMSSFAAIERALKSANCPWFGLDLDPADVLRDEWPMDEIFSRFGPLIRHVRGRDAAVGGDRRTKPMPIGSGNTDWGALLANLASADYHGWLTIDPIALNDRIAAAELGRKRLLEIVK